jgi:hypothetical protein
MLPDTSETKSNEFELWPAGWHEVTLHFAEEQWTNGPEPKQYLNVHFTNDSHKQPVFDKFFYQENCLWKLKALKKAIGVSDTEKRIEMLMGKRLQIKVAIREYKDDEQNEIKRYKPIEGESAKTEPEPKPNPHDGDKMPWDD